ncbi:MAG: carboxypeptidase regulatory-like domain-containing protein [Candidatus Kerfeldbacteria bacterium]|nr:carboxypeptidase regulatory-like domain-containing protein [Candidatus Kerfeldbacteria bacterium]
MKYILHKLILSLVAVLGLIAVGQPAFAADATITGTVTHAADGTPVTTLLIYAEDAVTGDYSYGYTDATTGIYTITITDNGSGTAGEYLVYNYVITGDEDNVTFIRSQEAVVLTEGENKTGINLSLTRRARFIGTVYESDGTTPIYNAYAYFTQDSGWTAGYGTDYSAYSGAYYVTPTPYPDTTQSAVGKYYVTVTAAGFFGTLVNDLALTADETDTAQNFTLTGQSTVSGTVTDRQGDPIAGATVTLDELNSNYTYTATTDSAGGYTLEVYDLYDYDGTAIGDYSLIFAADGYVTKSRLLSITTEESALTGEDATLRQAATMTGTIYETNGTTVVAGATIQADNGLGNVYTTTSEDDGSFTFASLQAGAKYDLTVTKTGYVKNVVYNVAVSAGETTADQDVLLTTTITLSGTVLARADGSEINGATIRLFDLSKPRSSTADYTTTALTDGTFLLSNIDPGHYRVHVSQAGYIKLKVSDLDLTTAVSGRDFKLEAAATIFGNVTNKNGEPVHNAYVSVSSKAASDIGYGTAYTDMNGNYQISSLKAGKYIVKVWTTGYVEKVVQTRARQGKKTELDVTLRTAGSISGQINDDATGLPLSGYQVRVKGESVTAYTDTNGYYILDGLASGKYTVYVISTAYQTMQRSGVQVRTNKETKYVNFALDYK